MHNMTNHTSARLNYGGAHWSDVALLFRSPSLAPVSIRLRRWTRAPCTICRRMLHYRPKHVHLLSVKMEDYR